MTDVDSIYRWLVAGAPGAVGPAQVVERLCDDLAAIIPVDRAAAFVRTLHPHIVGRSFTWERGKGVTIAEASFAVLQTPVFKNSPISRTFETRSTFRSRLAAEPAPRQYPILDRLASEGITDYYVSPLVFLSGQVHAITYATKAPAGFSDADIAAFDRLADPLARIAEILALTRTAVNLLDTYVGRNAGERIFQGRIIRGDTDSLRAVLWFSDLRGFTELASRVAPSLLIGVLNDLFDCQVPAIEKHGGEVLKFMGDGLLAIFPIAEGNEEAVCERAFAATDEAYAALDELNASRAARSDTPIKFGLALHVGEIAYGNIGGAGRLDFTCIGPAVNLAARLEGLTGKLGKPIVVSAEVARKTKRALVSMGEFDLKGVSGAQEVFAFPPDHRLATFDPVDLQPH